MQVSVTATVLNEREDVAGLVESLMGQTVAPAEVVVVDGGSVDGTWEWLMEAAARYPALVAIRDESCNLKASPGPIARGRNVGIAAARSGIVACADAGCVYPAEWLGRLTEPIVRGEAAYSLGGSCLDPVGRTVWDVAAAPFLGVRLSVGAPTKSCTARSMAFKKELWERVGRFSEVVFIGEDALFDGAVRAVARPAFPVGAKAMYRPHLSLMGALRQMASYAVADGIMGIRGARMARNAARCGAQMAGVALAGWSWVPLAIVAAVEVYYAYKIDWRDLRAFSVKEWVARLVFSVMVPWVVAWNQMRGVVTKRNPLNRQNAVAG